MVTTLLFACSSEDDGRAPGQGGNATTSSASSSSGSSTSGTAGGASTSSTTSSETGSTTTSMTTGSTTTTTTTSTTTTSSTTTSSTTSPPPGSAEAQLSFSQAMATNADTAPFSSTSGTLVEFPGNLVDIILSAPGGRGVELVIQGPFTVGTPITLDVLSPSFVTYFQDGNKKSWLSKQAPYGTVTIDKIEGTTYWFTIAAALMAPSGYIGTDSTGTFVLGGSGRFTLGK